MAPAVAWARQGAAPPIRDHSASARAPLLATSSSLASAQALLRRGRRRRRPLSHQPSRSASTAADAANAVGAAVPPAAAAAAAAGPSTARGRAPPSSSSSPARRPVRRRSASRARIDGEDDDLGLSLPDIAARLVRLAGPPSAAAAGGGGGPAAPAPPLSPGVVAERARGLVRALGPQLRRALAVDDGSESVPAACSALWAAARLQVRPGAGVLDAAQALLLAPAAMAGAGAAAAAGGEEEGAARRTRLRAFGQPRDVASAAYAFHFFEAGAARRHAAAATAAAAAAAASAAAAAASAHGPQGQQADGASDSKPYRQHPLGPRIDLWLELASLAADNLRRLPPAAVVNVAAGLAAAAGGRRGPAAAAPQASRFYGAAVGLLSSEPGALRRYRLRDLAGLVEAYASLGRYDPPLFAAVADHLLGAPAALPRPRRAEGEDDASTAPPRPQLQPQPRPQKQQSGRHQPSSSSRLDSATGPQLATIAWAFAAALQPRAALFDAIAARFALSPASAAALRPPDASRLLWAFAAATTAGHSAASDAATATAAGAPGPRPSHARMLAVVAPAAARAIEEQGASPAVAAACLWALGQHRFEAPALVEAALDALVGALEDDDVDDAGAGVAEEVASRAAVSATSTAAAAATAAPAAAAAPTAGRPPAAPAEGMSALARLLARRGMLRRTADEDQQEEGEGEEDADDDDEEEEEAERPVVAAGGRRRSSAPPPPALPPASATTKAPPPRPPPPRPPRVAARDASQALWACARLGHRNLPALEALALRLARPADPPLSPVEAASALWALARLGPWHSGGVLRGHCSSGSAQDSAVAALCRAVAAGARGGGSGGGGGGEGRAVATALWSLAALRWGGRGEVGLLCGAAARLLERDLRDRGGQQQHQPPRLAPRDLAVVAEALAELQWRPPPETDSPPQASSPPLLPLLVRRLSDPAVLRALRPAGAARVLWSAAVGRWADEALVRACCNAVEDGGGGVGGGGGGRAGRPLTSIALVQLFQAMMLLSVEFGCAAAEAAPPMLPAAAGSAAPLTALPRMLPRLAPLSAAAAAASADNGGGGGSSNGGLIPPGGPQALLSPRIMAAAEAAWLRSAAGAGGGFGGDGGNGESGGGGALARLLRPPAPPTAFQASVTEALRLAARRAGCPPPGSEVPTADGLFRVDAAVRWPLGAMGGGTGGGGNGGGNGGGGGGGGGGVFCAIGVEADGPHHFLRPAGAGAGGGERAPTGPTAARRRCLAARGYLVVHVPHHEWPRGRRSTTSKGAAAAARRQEGRGEGGGDDGHDDDETDAELLERRAVYLAGLLDAAAGVVSRS